MNALSKLLFKIYLYLKERFDPTQPATVEETFCTDICLSLIEMENSKLTYAPISNKRFIKNDSKGIFVVIDHRMINLINHVYGYNIMIEDDSYNFMCFILTMEIKIPDLLYLLLLVSVLPFLGFRISPKFRSFLL